MAYNYWKLMDKVGVAVCSQKPENWRGKESFDGYIFEVGDAKSKESAVKWATRYDNKWDNDKETITYEPIVREFENEGFTVTILDSAGGSSQGGRLSFWKCKVEKDGLEFIVGVNDAILADLIRNSDIEHGKVKQPVMFARRGGQPGFIHEGMEAYQEAQADMKAKADLKSAKKTSKWEIGGVYKTLTQTDVCLGEVYDWYEEYKEERSGYSLYTRYETKYRKRDVPVKVLAWKHTYNFKGEDDTPKSFEALLKEELKDREYVYFDTGKPPARAKADQLEVKESDMALLDKFLSLKKDGNYGNYFQGRYTREP